MDTAAQLGPLSLEIGPSTLDLELDLVACVLARLDLFVTPKVKMLDLGKSVAVMALIRTAISAACHLFFLLFPPMKRRMKQRREVKGTKWASEVKGRGVR